MTEATRRERLLAALATKTRLHEARLVGIIRKKAALGEEMAAATAAANGPHATLLLNLTGLQNRIIRLGADLASTEARAAGERHDIARLKAAAASIARRHLEDRARLERQRQEIDIVERVASTRPDSLPQDG